MDLGELFRKYGSDKDVNGYTPVYHTLFAEKRDKIVNFLEIGIGTMIQGAHSSMVGYAQEGYKPGGSLRAWRDYFPNANIHGADVQPDTQFSDEERITTHLCDSNNRSAVTAFFEQLGDISFDVILDDGDHTDRSQLNTLENFYPYLKDGGIYIIEDIYSGSLLSTLPRVLESYCDGDPYFFVGVKNNICVIYKNYLQRDTYRMNY